MATTQNIDVSRDYVDNFSIKELCSKEIMPTYFPDQDSDTLITGTIGMVNEYISVTAEDAFNTGSSLINEAFPSRCKMDSSIHANAAIFQLNDSFVTASSCNFIITIPEADILNNLEEKEGSSYKYFYLGKDTIISVDGIDFSLDYDIEIRASYRETQKGWVYSAKYIIGDMKNSVSKIRDPYIKLRKTANGVVALQVTLRQYTRTVIYEGIVDNAILNYPTIKVNLDGDIAGFDVMYKGAEDENFSTQLETRVLFSLPSKEPFLFYRMVNSELMELTFTTNSNYFQPDFNSEIRIVLYNSIGKGGDFEEYVGNSVDITKDEESYQYRNSWMITAIPMGASSGGNDRLTKDALRALSVEGFTTANALTTENDLQTYFNNYKYRTGAEVLFIKKRNDAVEMLFSAFLFLKKDDYIYPTNTLTIDTNLQLLGEKEGGMYVIDPGYLFGYKNIEKYFIPYVYFIVDGDGDYYTENGEFFNKEHEPDPEKNVTVLELAGLEATGQVTKSDHFYWAYDAGRNKYTLYHEDGRENDFKDPIKIEEMYDLIDKDEVVLVQESRKDTFAVDFLYKTDILVSAKKGYYNYFETYKIKTGEDKLTFDEYLFKYTIKDYMHEFGIDARCSIFNTDVEKFVKGKDFVFSNPFIMTILKGNNVVSFYQSCISQNSTIDFLKQNDSDSFFQFMTYTFHVERVVSEEKKYHINMAFLASQELESTEDSFCSVIYDESDPDLFIKPDEGELVPTLNNFDKSLLSQNRLRVILTFNDGENDVGYMELIPTGVNEDNQISFEADFLTDDSINSSNRFQSVHKCPHCGAIVTNSANYRIANHDYYCNNCDKTFKDGIINIRESDSLLLPINNAVVKITTIFKDPANDENPITDNDFYQHDKTYEGYIWTNLYSTLSEKIMFIQPLTMLRSILSYKDYFENGVDAMDCTLADIPLLKYSIMAYRETGMVITDPLVSDDIGKFNHFMKTFTDNYAILRTAKEKMNGMSIDAKFYNTYGRSTNFFIDEDENIDTNNISISFDIWVRNGTDLTESDKEIRQYIKQYIENVNSTGTNNLYISNLIKALENQFAYIHHLQFNGINNYGVTYQSIINYSIEMDQLTKEERRKFVPDLLVVNLNNIFLTMYEET